MDRIDERLYVWDGYMNYEWIDGWMNEWMGDWVDGCIEGWKVG
jgi:hypothetical protein